MFFDAVAKRSKTRFGNWYWRKCFSKKLDCILATSGKPKACLEIGPGEGAFARLCREHEIRYQGIERSETYQERLRSDGFDVQLGSVPPLPFESESFDLVVLLAVLEHMPTFEQGLGLLQECRRVLPPGGAIAVHVPDFIRAGIDFYAWDYTHSFVMTRLRLHQMLVDVGFEPVRTVQFTGALTSPFVRWPVDLLGFLVHSRFSYWLGNSIGAGGLVFRFHKTFEPGVFTIAKRA